MNLETVSGKTLTAAFNKWKEKYPVLAERAREALNNARQLNAQLCRTIELSL